MPKYVFVVETTISLATEVEADSLSEAVGKAKTRAAQSVQYGDHASEWATAAECEPSQGDLVDFHFGQGETFTEAAAVWETE